MKNKKGFTLIELLAVIVVLAIVTTIAVSAILPYTGSGVREDAFRIEASNVVKAADDFLDSYNLGINNIKIDNNETSCKSANKVCLTVNKLIDSGFYKAEKGTFNGKVEITIGTPNSYTLYFQKGAEFSFVGQKYRDYQNNGELSTDSWKDEYNSCSCE